jgi:hypothetical protein
VTGVNNKFQNAGTIVSYIRIQVRHAVFYVVTYTIQAIHKSLKR